MAKRPKQKSIEELTKQVDEWNAKVNVGDTVNVTLDNKNVITATVTSKAFVMGGHSAMVMIFGMSGAYSLDRVRLPLKL